MPSPVRKEKESGLYFYRRKDGAWIYRNGRFIKVGRNKFKNEPHYSLHITRIKGKRIGDYYRKARKGTKKQRKRYPHEYD